MMLLRHALMISVGVVSLLIFINSRVYLYRYVTTDGYSTSAVGSDASLGTHVPVVEEDLMILMWHPWINKIVYFKGAEYGHPRCENVTRHCTISLNESDYHRSDMVVFNMFYVQSDKFPMPKGYRRPQGQLWMSYYREAPTRSVVTSSSSGMFNVTASYSTTTDVLVPYFRVTELPPRPKRRNDTPTIDDIIAAKSLPVLWAVSHCRTTSLRELYARELRKHISVTVTGGCPGAVKLCPKHDSECERREYSRYYFYLAFENNICQDYITEKVWARLKVGLVPVVLGRGNYTRDLPPHSFIDIEDFDSPALLAKYLTELIADPVEYARYHAWRLHYQISSMDIYCEFCRYLNRDLKDVQRIIPDVNDVFSVTQCTNPYKYYEGSFDAVHS